jgi:hypothetical protein
MPDDIDVKQNREDFQEARRALVDRYVAEHPGLSHQDFNDVKVADFGSHAATVATQRASQDREAGARALGITVEEFDALKAKPAEAAEETPQSRTANLPTGKATTPPKPTSPGQNVDGGTLSGIDLIERAAAEDFAHLFGNAD